MRRDACVGHVGRVTLNGTRVCIYHDHATLEYPYPLRLLPRPAAGRLRLHHLHRVRWVRACLRDYGGRLMRVVVASRWDVDEPWPSILPWQSLGHDAEHIHAALGRPLVLLSDDDPFTSDWRRNRDEWVERLDADVRVHPGAKHFNAARESAVLAAIRKHRSHSNRGEAGPLENEL